MDIPYRPLGLISTLVDRIDLSVTYAHEDLVFVKHNAFVLKMEDVGERVSIYFNEESESAERGAIAETLIAKGAEMGLAIVERGTFVMKQKDDKNLEICFQQSEVSDAE